MLGKFIITNNFMVTSFKIGHSVKFWVLLYIFFFALYGIGFVSDPG